MNTVEREHKFAHHFDSAEHEHETGKFGVWAFLATEILMFGGLFVGYAIFYNLFPETFVKGGEFLDWRYGSVNTVVLLISSLTMALAIRCCQVNNKKGAITNLVITLICAGIFMVIKYLEYTHKIHEGLLPGQLFSYTGDVGGIENMGLYFSFYFCMTGLHGIHVLFGMILITWVLIRTMRDEFHSNHYTAVEGVGLFWHLVDLIWIYLFPLLYLM